MDPTKAAIGGCVGAIPLVVGGIWFAHLQRSAKKTDGLLPHCPLPSPKRFDVKGVRPVR
ncbi:hypothetical protein [Planctomyces sp. SH-PL14]|uniref:hypothetical protein n=1 Tax=Planctomyces sp. SH-PL14 TaxID=1632864 RepID=UPI0012E78D77|nr:hypothetical protein [Planctomyces sp. SH-PL14]